MWWKFRKDSRYSFIGKTEKVLPYAHFLLPTYLHNRNVYNTRNSTYIHHHNFNKKTIILSMVHQKPFYKNQQPIPKVKHNDYRVYFFPITYSANCVGVKTIILSYIYADGFVWHTSISSWIILEWIEGCECFDIIRPNTQNLINYFFWTFLVFFYFYGKYPWTRFLCAPFLQLSRLYINNTIFHPVSTSKKGKLFHVIRGSMIRCHKHFVFFLFNSARH